MVENLEAATTVVVVDTELFVARQNESVRQAYQRPGAWLKHMRDAGVRVMAFSSQEDPVVSQLGDSLGVVAHRFANPNEAARALRSELFRSLVLEEHRAMPVAIDGPELVVEINETGTRLATRDQQSSSPAIGPDHQQFDVLRVAGFNRSTLLPALGDLEALIRDDGVAERELQDFMEAYPEFITGIDYIEAVPLVVFELDDGSKHIPDFVLRPIGSDPCDLLELKRPDAKVVTVVGNDRVLSRTAAAGVRQLERYSEALFSPGVRDRVAQQYGLEIVRPRLQLVVGRISSVNPSDIRAAAAFSTVQVETWDHILTRNRFRLTGRHD